MKKQIEGMKEVERLARGCMDQMIEDATEAVEHGEEVIMCFPAEEYRMVAINGIFYQMRVTCELFSAEEWENR